VRAERAGCGLVSLAALVLVQACGSPEQGEGPLANVYRVNPVEDSHLTQVELRHLRDPHGPLLGDYVNVWNCVADEDGEQAAVKMGGLTLSGRLCTPLQKARPGDDGTFRHIGRPAEDTDGTSSFGEVMMYHHVTTIHDHYSGYGLTHIDKPVKAIVNLQGYVDAFGKWVGFPNAGYFPMEQTQLIEQLLGVDLLKGEEAIAFGYNNLSPQIDNVNFSFDAMTIYHEYTHYVIGGNRLVEAAVDRYGIDASPLALNEAFADYFPSSYLNTSKAGGTYTLGHLARDLSQDFRCPDHLTGESHIDGEVASGAFWALRALLGADLTDRVLWNAVLTFGKNTSFEQAGQAILDEVRTLAPRHLASAEKILTERGVIGCTRLKVHQDYDNNGPMASYSPVIEGTQAAPVQFADGVPGFVQYRVSLERTTREVTIEYSPVFSAAAGMGGARGDVSVALRRGSAPITYDYGSGKAVSSAQIVLKGDPSDELSYRLVLSGSCVDGGDLVFQFVSHEPEAGYITKVKVTQRPTAMGPSNFDGCRVP